MNNTFFTKKIAAIVIALAVVLPTTALAGYSYFNHSLSYIVDGTLPAAISVAINANPSSMTLPTNQTTLTWTTTGTPDSCTASNAWTGAKNAAGGSEVIGGLTVGSYVYDITCSKAGSQNASASALVVVSEASGTLAANDCTIASGGSTCSSSVTWTTSNLSANPTSITRNTGTPASFTPSPLAGGSQPVTLDYGTTTFYLYHNSALLAQDGGTASCTSGTSWDGNSCETAAGVTANLSANPTSIIGGDSSNLTWSSSGATSCTGTNFSTGFSNATSGNTDVYPLSTTVYTVTCSGPGGSAQDDATVTVSGSPQCSDDDDNDGDTKIDYPNDPGCTSPFDDDETNALPECSDNIDNDDTEDILVDTDDPGCHTDGNAANPASYDANDNDEGNRRKPIFIEF